MGRKALVRAHRIAHSRFLDAAMRDISLMEPAQRVPTIIDLVNRSASFVDMVADQQQGQRGARRLMASDVDQLQRVVSDVLGDLGVDDERNGWLCETLRECLSRNRGYVATADGMILHRNTIQHRALEVCRWMAPTVLRGK